MCQGIKRRHYITLPKLYNVKEVLTEENLSLKEKDFDGNMVKMSSDRYQLMKRDIDNLSCVSCNRIGTHLKLERSLQKNKNKVENEKYNRYHFNLYTDDDVLMTKDHIIPKSLGGPDKLDNYQIMCTNCNSKKGNGLSKKENDLRSIQKQNELRKERGQQVHIKPQVGKSFRLYKYIGKIQYNKNKEIIRTYSMINKSDLLDKKLLPQEIVDIINEVESHYKIFLDTFKSIEEIPGPHNGCWHCFMSNKFRKNFINGYKEKRF